MTEQTRISNWIQDNLRIIISIGIVILLVFAIYSYSKRNSNSAVVVDEVQTDDIAIDTTEGNAEINEIIDEIKDEEQQQATDVVTDVSTISENKDSAISQEQVQSASEITEETPQQESSEATTTEQAQEIATTNDSSTEQQPAETEEKQTAEEVVREVIATQQQKTSDIITVTAESGDSATTLARKAAKQYIAQQNLSDITAAHKIYIEDYLRRLKNTRSIHPGTTLDFSSAEISDAIAQARQLNSAQLDHLNTYAQRVSNL